jgi:predicted RNase H-related nuclease YkuK (DUF458 family)
MAPNQFFNSSFGLQLSPEQVVRELVRFMREDKERMYKLTIGTDSELSAGKTADFVTAIVIHRVGNGGRYFWRRIEGGRIFHTLRERILEEVLISLDVAKHFLELVRATPELPHFDFEIHVDVGENGATRIMIQELVGMVRANNFEARTKPESYAASNVADKHV